jgi:ketosteroid isomerase-like protein
MKCMMGLAFIAMGVSMSTGTGAQQSTTISASGLEAWLAGYESAWEERDADAAAALFSDDALYYEDPYSDPFEGPAGIRQYWANVTADQRNVDFESSIVGIVGSTGVARWSARFTLASNGADVELNGIFLLDFDTDGKCRQLREWWHAR